MTTEGDRLGTGEGGAETAGLVEWTDPCPRCRDGQQTRFQCVECRVLSRIGTGKPKPPRTFTAYELTLPGRRARGRVRHERELPPPEDRRPAFPGCGHPTTTNFLPPLLVLTACRHCKGTGERVSLIPEAEAARRREKARQQKEANWKRLGSLFNAPKVPRCGVPTRAGGTCQGKVVPGRDKCRLHCGVRTGPRPENTP